MLKVVGGNDIVEGASVTAGAHEFANVRRRPDQIDLFNQRRSLVGDSRIIGCTLPERIRIENVQRQALVTVTFWRDRIEPWTDFDSAFLLRYVL